MGMPVERISRRSRVDRPTIGALETMSVLIQPKARAWSLALIEAVKRNLRRRRLRARFGHVVVSAEAESTAYGICRQLWRSAIRHFHGCAALLPPCKL